MSLPVFLVSVLPVVNPFAGQAARAVVVGCLVFVNLAALIRYLVDLGHYAYLDTRLNRTALGYLRDLGTSLAMVRQTYPVGWGFLGLLVAGTLIGFGANREIGWLATAPLGTGNGLGVAVSYGVTVVAIGLGLYGSFTHYPLRWSNAFFRPARWSRRWRRIQRSTSSRP
jgi:hypothetical protein